MRYMPNGSSVAGTPLTSAEVRGLAEASQAMALYHSGALKSLAWANADNVLGAKITAADTATSIKLDGMTGTIPMEIPWVRASSQFTSLLIYLTFATTHAYPYRWRVSVSELAAATWAGSDWSPETRPRQWSAGISQGWAAKPGYLYDTAVIHASTTGSSGSLLRLRPEVIVNLAALATGTNDQPTVMMYGMVIADAYAHGET
jgi:hypothetical protein